MALLSAWAPKAGGGAGGAIACPALYLGKQGRGGKRCHFGISNIFFVFNNELYNLVKVKLFKLIQQIK